MALSIEKVGSKHNITSGDPGDAGDTATPDAPGPTFGGQPPGQPRPDGKNPTPEESSVPFDTPGPNGAAVPKAGTTPEQTGMQQVDTGQNSQGEQIDYYQSQDGRNYAHNPQTQEWMQLPDQFDPAKDPAPEEL